MPSQSLAKIGQLKPHSATAEEVQRLLAAVRRNLADAGRAGNSTETRFDCAYKAIMQCALVRCWRAAIGRRRVPPAITKP